MKKDDHNKKVFKERVIMISTSALVLTVLTVTGAYVRNHNREAQDHGYTLDFSELENGAEDKWKEITNHSGQNGKKVADNGAVKDLEGEAGSKADASLKAGSDEIKIPGLTEGAKSKDGTVDQSNSKTMSDGAKDSLVKKNEGKKNEEKKSEGKKTEVKSGEEKNSTVTEKPVEKAEAKVEVKPEEAFGDRPLEIVETAAESPVIPDVLTFHGDNMIKPVSGEPLIEYSMDHSVYFATLDQYKYNPAMIYKAQQGEDVLACCEGRVLSIRQDPELGHVLEMDLGDGYRAVYGQLQDIAVPIGGAVTPGMKIASVAAPTKYYGVEGANLYFQILKDGKSVDPGQYF